MGWDLTRRIIVPGTYPKNALRGWDQPAKTFLPETLAYLRLPGASGDPRTIDAIIRSIKNGGTLTIAGLTCKISYATYFFLTQPSVDLRKYVGFAFSLDDGTGKYLRAVFGGVGSAETLSATEKLGNVAFDNTNNCNVGANAAIASIAGGQDGNCLELTRVAGLSQYVYVQNAANGNIVLTASALYKHGAYVKSGTSGNEAFILQHENNQGAVIGTSSGDWVAYSGYFTKSGGQGAHYFWKNSATAGTMLFDTAYLRQVLTPSASGALALVAPGGAAGIISVDSGFNPNATSFTLAVTSP